MIIEEEVKGIKEEAADENRRVTRSRGAGSQDPTEHL